MVQHLVSFIASNGLLDLDASLRVEIYHVVLRTSGPSITRRLKQRVINQFQGQEIPQLTPRVN